MDEKVTTYIAAIKDQTRRKDTRKLVETISEIGPASPKMWGNSIISFGLYHYKYESGREGDAPIIGLSNRKQAIVLYGLHVGESGHLNNKIVMKLGKYKTGKGCLYISKVSDIDLNILKVMIQNTHKS